MVKMIIGIPANLQTVQRRFSTALHVDLNNTYLQAIFKNNAIPSIIPYNNDLNSILPLLAVCDGFLFPGGGDVDPQYYGEDPFEKIGPVLSELDSFQSMVMTYAMEHNKPILGICRGMQLLNIMEGGTLYQDLSQHTNTSLQHVQLPAPDKATHQIEIIPGSKLHKILNLESVRVNSFHHQAVKDIAPKYIETATASDQIIEAIEYTGDTFRLGVQWHPEGMILKNDQMNALFKALIQACENNH